MIGFCSYPSVMSLPFLIIAQFSTQFLKICTVRGRALADATNMNQRDKKVGEICNKHMQRGGRGFQDLERNEKLGTANPIGLLLPIINPMFLLPTKYQAHMS